MVDEFAPVGDLPPEDPLQPQQPETPQERVAREAPRQGPQEPTGLPKSVGEVLALRRKQQERLALEQFDLATKSDPALAGEAQQIAKKLGVDPATASRNIDVARQAAQRRELDESSFFAANPVIAQAMKDIEFAQAAHRDFDNLGFIERSVRQFGGGYTAGQFEAELGRLGARLGQLKVFGDDLTNDEWKRIAFIRRELDRLPSQGTVFGSAGHMVGQMSVTLPQALTTGLAAGNVAALGATLAGPASPLTVPAAFAGGFTAGTASSVFASSMAIQFGTNYLDMLDHGFSERSAWWASLASGAFTGATEVLGDAVLSRAVRGVVRQQLLNEVKDSLTRPGWRAAGVEFAKKWAENVASETSIETSQSLVEMMTEEMARVIDKQDPKGQPLSSRVSRGEVGKELLETAVSTAKGMVLLGAFDPGIKLYQDAKQIAKANRSFAELGKLLDGTKESELRKVNPEMAERFFGQLTRGKIDALYVDRATFAKVLRQIDAESSEGGALEKSAADRINEIMPDAFAGDGDVVLPTDRYMAHFAGSKLDKALRPHLRIDPGDISQAEAESIDMKARVEDFKKAVDDREKFDASAQEVEDRTLKSLDAARQKAGATKLTPEQSKIAALLIRSFYEQRATREGRLPSEIPELRFTEEAPATGALNAPGKGAFDPSKLLIHLTTESDASTLMHEMSHGFFHLMLNTPSPDVQTITDVQTLMDWFKVKDTGAWQALGFDGQERHQEALARAFEHYIAEGEAPSIELQHVFEKAARWLRTVYEGVLTRIDAAYQKQFGVGLPALTPEVRRVFGAMLASQDAIDDTMAIRGQAALFDSRENFPGSDEDWAEYQALEQARREGGISKLTAEMQKNISWLAGRKKQLETEITKEAREQRKRAGEEAHTELSQTPVYSLRTWINTARQGDEGTHRLNAQSIREAFGTQADDIINRLGKAVSERGWQIDQLADQFGFETGQAMVEALVGAPTLADAVASRTDEIMLRDHSTLRDAQSQAQAIDDALNTEAASKLLASVLRMADKLSNPDRLTLAAAKEQARRILLETPVGKIKARSYLMTAAREEKKAAEAFNGKRASKSKTTGEKKEAKAPNPQEGIDHLRRALLNAELARQAARIEKEIGKTIDRLENKFFSPDASLVKNRNLDWVNTGRAILGGYSIGPQSKLPLEWFASLAEYDPVLHGLLDGHVQRVTQGNTLQDYRHLTLDAFRDLAENLTSLWDRAGREKQIQVGEKLLQKDAIHAELKNLLRKKVGDLKVAPLTPAERKTSLLNTSVAKLGKVEHVLRWLDGAAGGPFTRYLWTTLRNRFDAYQIERHDYMQRFNALFAGLQDAGLLSRVKFDATKTLGHVFDSTTDVLGALIHMGNESNLENLLKGYGWTPAQWQAFLVQLQQSGRITVDHIKVLQKIGDLFDELKTKAQKVNKEANGTYFKEVEIKPIETPWGRFEGWYAPSTPDPMNPNNSDIALVEDGPNPNLTAAKNMAYSSAAPKVPAGWMKSRVGGTRPRLMDITRIPGAFDQQLRFIHLEQPLRDTWNLVNDAEMSSLLEAAAPGFVRNILKPTLDDTANGRMSKPGLGGPLVDKVLNMIRRNVSRMYMFGSSVNWLQQYTGASAILSYVSKDTAFEALGAVKKLGLQQAWQQATGESQAMQARFQEHSGAQMQDLHLWLDPSTWGKVGRAADKASYWLINKSQTHTDLVAYFAGKNDYLEKHPGDERGAIEAGDALVRLTQGSRTTIDTAAIERSTPAVQLMAQFSHYWVNLLNQIKFTDSRSRAIVWSFLAPTFTGAAIAAALSGGKAFEDEKTKEEFAWQRALWWFASTPVKGGGSMLPVIGPMASWLFTSTDRPGATPPLFPALRGLAATRDLLADLVENIQYAAGVPEVVARANSRRGGALKGQELRDIGLTIAFWTGIPVNRVLDAWAFLEDRADRVTDRNLFSGLTGSAR